MADANNTNPNEAAAAQPQFQLVRIYSKDASLETPHTPEIFSKAWKPEVKVQFDPKMTKIPNGDLYEVALRVTVTCNNEGSTAFVCEVVQAGLFLIRNFDENGVNYMLHAVAPDILFPYAREYISNLVTRATFPPINLAPVSFEAIYRSRRAQAAAQAAQPAENQPQGQA